jgi:hypothetical protein
LVDELDLQKARQKETGDQLEYAMSLNKVLKKMLGSMHTQLELCHSATLKK